MADPSASINRTGCNKNYYAAVKRDINVFTKRISCRVAFILGKHFWFF